MSEIRQKWQERALKAEDELFQAKAEIEGLKAEAGYYDAEDAMKVMKAHNDILIAELSKANAKINRLLRSRKP